MGYSPQDCKLDVTERLSMILYYTLFMHCFFLNFFTFINGCDHEGFIKCHKTLFAIELSTSKQETDTGTAIAFTWKVKFF